MIKENCGLCRFVDKFKEIQSPKEDRKIGLFRCNRRAPVARQDGNDDPKHPNWPRVLDRHWCGDFEPKTEMHDGGELSEVKPDFVILDTAQVFTKEQAQAMFERNWKRLVPFQI